LQKNGGHSQQLLFPKTLVFSPADFIAVMDIQEEIRALGFSFEEFGKNTLLINGVPADVHDENEKELFESLVRQYQDNLENLHIGKKESVARAFSKRSATKYVGKLGVMELNLLVHQLFGTSTPAYTPTGEATFKSFSLNELAEMF
jgi:DNA mismatch repair protein MutL